MPMTVAMYEAAHADIGARLDALGLDLQIATFDKAGTYTIGGRTVAPADAAIDFFWLTTHATIDMTWDEIVALLAATRSIGVLQTFSAGMDRPIYAALSARGTRILNSAAQGIAIAEYTMAQVMAVFHPVAKQRDLQVRKEWRFTPFREISKTHWLIVGYGPIGREIALRARAFDASVSVVRRSPASTPLADRAGTMADLPAFLPDADVIILACPLTPATRDMAGPAFFAAVKPGAVLVNIARGGLIDEPALIAALDRRQLATAVLDVTATEPLPTDDPLWTHPHVRLTAHTSWFGSGIRARWDALFLDAIALHPAGGRLPGEVAPADLV